MINKTTTRLILLVAVLLFGTSNMSYGVGAYPEPVVVIQPDGSQITIKIHGDEFFNYTTTSDGYIISLGADKHYYYADYNSGKLNVSNVKVGKGSAIGRTKSIPSYVISSVRHENMTSMLGGKASRTGGVPYTKGEMPAKPKVLILLVQYTNIKFLNQATANQDFDAMANEVGYSVNSATGSIADYYHDNSMGTFVPKFEVYGPYDLPNDREYYTLNNARNKEQTIHAMNVADSEIDFKDYASNGSDIDMVLLYYAGHNSAELGPGVWPHKSDISSLNLEYDGVKAGVYACTSELRGASGTSMAGIGTMAHEYSHVLGLADTYSVSNSGNTTVKSWGYMDIMNYGNYTNGGLTPPLFSAYQREIMGWLEFEDIDASGDYALEPLINNKAYRIKTDVEGEFYTLESRNTGENKWDKYIGGRGMMVFHIDRSDNIFYSSVFEETLTASQAWGYNVPNSTPEHLCADMVEASGSQSSDQAGGGLLFPGSLGVTSLKSSSTKPPMLFAWSGINLGVDITNIQLAGNNITFTVAKENIDYQKAQLTGTVKSVMEGSIANAIINVYDAAKGTSSEPLFTTTTDNKGVYNMVNLDINKSYLLEAISSPLYMSGKITKSFVKGMNTLDFKLLLDSENPYKDIMRWYSDDNGSSYGLSGDLYARIVFAPTDLVKFLNNQIHRVNILTDSKATYATLSITSNGVDLVKDMRVAQTGGGEIIFELTSLNISKKNDEELVVTIKTNGRIYLDETTVIDGKGNLLSSDGKTWGVIPNYIPGVNGSWVIGVDLNKNMIEKAPFPAIKIATIYTVGGKFNPGLNNATKDDVESVKYSVNDTEITEAYVFPSVGSYTIVAEIKYTAASGMGTETITRIVTVK